MHATLPLLRSRDFPAIARNRVETLQINVGYKTLAVRYDYERRLAQFDRMWPADSPAAVSYRKRITDGPGYDPAQAVRRAVRGPTARRQNAATG